MIALANPVVNQPRTEPLFTKRARIQSEGELSRHIDAIIKLNGQVNSSVFTDVTLLKFAFKDALQKKQSPFIIVIYDDQSNLQALIPLYCIGRKQLQILWDKTSDYVDILATNAVVDYVKAEFNQLLKEKYSFCLNKIAKDATILKVLEDFRAPLQKNSRERLENAWAISKLNELPKFNARDMKRRKSQLKKRGVRVEYIDKHDADKKIRESILEIIFLKHVEFASRNKPYVLNLELNTLIELVFSLVKEGKAFIAKTIAANSLIDAAILFFKDSSSIYSIIPTYNPHAPHSPGLSLMYWTIEDFLNSQNGLVVYDFTIGDEPYKKRFSNQKTQIYTIFVSNRISHRVYYFFICKILDHIKSNAALNNFKLSLINRLLSAEFVLKKFISKVKNYTSIGLLSAVKRYALNKTSSALILARDRDHSYQPAGLDQNRYRFSTVNLSDLIEFYSRNISDRYEIWSKINASIYRMVNKCIPYGIFLDENLVSLAWVQCAGKYAISEKRVAFHLKEDECAIFDVMTDNNYRRKGLYSLLQYNMLTTDEIKKKKILLHVMSNNIAAVSVHKKLGYSELRRIS